MWQQLVDLAREWREYVLWFLGLIGAGLLILYRMGIREGERKAEARFMLKTDHEHESALCCDGLRYEIKESRIEAENRYFADMVGIKERLAAIEARQKYQCERIDDLGDKFDELTHCQAETRGDIKALLQILPQGKVPYGRRKEDIGVAI